MARKVRWLTFWVTVVFWLGSAWGCASRMQEMRAPGPAPVIDVPAVAEQQPARLGAVLPGAVPTDRTAAGASGTAMADLPRQQFWPEVLVGPARGATRHHPVYFHDLEWGRSDQRAESQLVADQMSAALDTAKSSSAMVMAADAVVQPAKFAADLGLLPVKMAARAPWTHVTTAPRP